MLTLAVLVQVPNFHVVDGPWILFLASVMTRLGEAGSLIERHAQDSARQLADVKAHFLLERVEKKTEAWLKHVRVSFVLHEHGHPFLCNSHFGNMMLINSCRCRLQTSQV